MQAQRQFIDGAKMGTGAASPFRQTFNAPSGTAGGMVNTANRVATCTSLQMTPGQTYQINGQGNNGSGMKLGSGGKGSGSPFIGSAGV